MRITIHLAEALDSVPYGGMLYRTANVSCSRQIKLIAMWREVCIE